MMDLLAAGGLVLVFEGLLWAVAPQLGLKLLRTAAELPEATLRTMGTLVVAAGVLVVWLVRG